MPEAPTELERKEIAQIALDRLWKMLEAQVAANRRFRDHAAIVLGASAAGFGLIGSTMERGQHSKAQLILLAVAVFFLVAELVCALIMWWPRKVEFPGDNDVHKIWNGYVRVPIESALANFSNDLCKAIEREYKITAVLGPTFEAFLVAAIGALALITIATLC